MQASALVEQYVSTLLTGSRPLSRELVRRHCEGLSDVESVYFDLLWPAMEQVARLCRSHRITIAAEHLATRISRCIADQVQARLEQRERNGKRILVACGDGEPEELGAQMCTDLFESRGWEVYFLGAGVPNDEILTLVGQLRPEILLIFGTAPSGVPEVRRLIDLIRHVDAHPTMNIMVSGGVYDRADGLWREINADLFAKSAKESLQLAEQAPPRVAKPLMPGTPKKRRRRRRPPLLAGAEA